MNEPMLRMMMDAIDDDLLEEAQRPLPARRPALRWGTLAACLCITAALLLAQPWRADRANSAAGTDNAAPSTAPAESSAEPLSATLALPADAVRVSGYDTRTDDAGAVTAVSCTLWRWTAATPITRRCTPRSRCPRRTVPCPPPAGRWAA